MVSRRQMDAELQQRDDRLRWFYGSGGAIAHGERELESQLTLQGGLGGWEPGQGADMPCGARNDNCLLVLLVRRWIASWEPAGLDGSSPIRLGGLSRHLTLLPLSLASPGTPAAVNSPFSRKELICPTALSGAPEAEEEEEDDPLLVLDASTGHHRVEPAAAKQQQGAGVSNGSRAVPSTGPSTTAAAGAAPQQEKASSSSTRSSAPRVREYSPWNYTRGYRRGGQEDCQLLLGLAAAALEPCPSFSFANDCCKSGWIWPDPDRFLRDPSPLFRMHPSGAV